ncbi:MAG: hypothetical protein JSR26_11030 [Proteobacteria bacterium]|nr:hypothetical protein [Pseudomonadota bacterium]
MLLELLAATPLHAQSDAPSQASELSMAPSQASAAVAIETLPAGSHLVVTALRPMGELVEVSAETTGHVAITGLRVSAKTAREVGLSVGATLAVTAIGAGWVISAAGETLAFVPDRLARSLTHHREL